jgi:molybdopterin/thiamine biosynthesis adenylyltransferase
VTIDHSRTLRLASNAGSQAGSQLLDRLDRTHVLVTADPDQPGVSAALRVLVADLRRLPIQLHLDPRRGSRPLTADQLDQLAALAAGIDRDRPLHLGPAPHADLHLHLGTSPASATVSAVPDGHGTRLRRAGHPFPRLGAPGSGLGAVSTAAMLTAEAFKTIIGVIPDRRRLVQALDFDPVTLTTPATAAACLPILDHVALIGAGAIGTAIALILRELGAKGSLLVIDPEAFDAPNVTTYSLGTQNDADQQIPKVLLIQSALPGLHVHPIRGSAQDLIEAVDQHRLCMPTTVLGAVDSVDARHQIAALHADCTLDGSTGGSTGTTLSLAEALPPGPCLRCYYPAVPTTGRSTEQLIVEATGLTLDRLARGDQPLTVDEIEQLPPDVQSRLAEHVGKPVCGLGRALGLTGRTDDYQPSAAFVAQQAAALVVGALIRRHDAAPGPRALDVEYDAMFGPHPTMIQTRRPRGTCRCQTDRELINVVRDHRSGPADGTLRALPPIS